MALCRSVLAAAVLASAALVPAPAAQPTQFFADADMMTVGNELSHYGRGYSYAPVNQEKFRAWLRGRYVTIDALNAAWGNASWSQNYNDVSQVETPNADELVAAIDEHSLLDFHLEKDIVRQVSSTRTLQSRITRTS